MEWKRIINDRFKNIRDILFNAKSNGKTLVGYGAPTKATLFLKKLNLNNNDIRCIIEDNSLKVGCYLPRTGIPIIHFDDYKFSKNDFIICFAWNFYDDIYAKLKKNNVLGTLFNVRTMENKII